LSLAVVRDLRVARPPATAEDIAALETDVVAGFVLARAAAGLADSTISSDVLHLEQLPLEPSEIKQSITAATTPAARVVLALGAVHAARPKAIRELRLDDIDLGNRRLTITGRTRPLDGLTRTMILEWLDHRPTRCPNTANRHLIINQNRSSLGSS
jgi:integrase